MPGKFIVFEGIDGSGAETQSKLLVKRLKKARKKVLFVSYPDYSKPIGKMIEKYLHGTEHVAPELQFILFTSDFMKDQKKLKSFLAKGGWVVANRYFTSTLAYQSVAGAELGKMAKLGDMFELLKPDVAIYLDISPKTSAKRKMEEKGSLDRHESNPGFLAKVAEAYRHLAKSHVFCKWASLDGEKSIEEVSAGVEKVAGF